MEDIAKLFQGMLLLTPGYLAVKLRQAVTEARDPSKFELIVQSIIFTVIIYSLFLASPFFAGLIDIKAFLAEPSLDIIVSSRFLLACLAVGFFTVVVGSMAAIVRYRGLFFKLLDAVGFKRLNRYLTTWEEFADLAWGKWVAVQLTNNFIYVGMVRSVTHYPYDKEMILTSAAGSNGEPYPIQIYNRDLEKIEAVTPADYVLIRAENIATASILRAMEAPETTRQTRRPSDSQTSDPSQPPTT